MTSNGRGAMQKLAMQKAQEGMGALNAEEVAYLLLGLDVDPTIAYAFEHARVGSIRAICLLGLLALR